MRRTIRSLAVMGAAFALAGSQARADERAGNPVRLADDELAQVTGGDGSLLDLNLNLDVVLKNIAVTVNVSNVPINAGAVVQANLLGTAAQTATVQALQEVTQLQQLPSLARP
jgi:hypothetical protein